MGDRGRHGLVVAVVSGRGGVGKSVSVGNLAVSLVQQGYRVAAVDGDLALPSLDLILGLEAGVGSGLAAVLAGRVPAEEALVPHPRWPGLALLPGLPVGLPARPDLDPAAARALWPDLAERFDFVLVDCPAGLENGLRLAAAGARQAIVVLAPGAGAVRSADRVLGALRAEAGFDDGQLWLLFNRYRPGPAPGLDRPDDLTALLGVKVLGVIPEDDAMVQALARGVPAAAAPSSPAGAAFRRAAERLAESARRQA